MVKPLTLKDHLREARIYRIRALVTLAFVLLLTGLLVIRMYHLQVAQHETYVTLSDKNRISIEPIAPNRGLIYDRNGELLADNQPTFAVSLLKERTPDLDAAIDAIGQLIELPESAAERFHRRLQQRRRPFTPVALHQRLTEDELAILAVRQHELPGMMLEANLVRHYPHEDALAHAIGYVGRINEAELRKLDPNNYSATEHIGKTGVERYYEAVLHGTVGYQTIETDARGRITRTLERTDPEPGQNLHLYLDLPTQLAAIDAIRPYRAAVVAIDPSTGGVLAFASMPAFDPNLFVTGIDFATFDALNHSRARPLFNRVIQAQYPPGSTVKPILGLAALEAGVTTWDHLMYDPGFYKLENDSRLYRDWRRFGHGRVTLHDAVVQSCDTYYYDIAHKMGVDTMHDFMVPFGIGRPSGIDLVGERRGLMPSRDWKRNARGQPWYPGETLITGIGQGYMLATPLQLALSTAILANRGRSVQPRMVRAIEHHGEWLDPWQSQPALPAIQLQDPSHWETMIQAMRDVVHHPKGTAQGIRKGLQGYDIAGKTGTAQVVGIAQGEQYDEEALAEWHRDHALFIGFAPVDKPRIAIAVVVENTGGGGSTAAPVARQVLDAFFANNPLESSHEAPADE